MHCTITGVWVCTDDPCGGKFVWHPGILTSLVWSAVGTNATLVPKAWKPMKNCNIKKKKKTHDLPCDGWERSCFSHAVALKKKPTVDDNNWQQLTTWRQVVYCCKSRHWKHLFPPLFLANTRRLAWAAKRIKKLKFVEIIVVEKCFLYFLWIKRYNLTQIREI